MANELTLNASLAYEDSLDVADALEVVEKLVSLTTKKMLRTKQSVGLSEEALVLGDITTRGWVLIVNVDPTNFVNVKTGTGGTIFAKLFPGEFCFLRLGSGAQSPYVIADTAECDIDILLVAV